MELLTVFTPTYNRKEKLGKLYHSLEQQTCKDFVWLIVDDGSSDHTDEYIEEVKKTASFRIEYLYQSNGGKSAAHNKGVELTETELFTCVDSDDYLTPDCVDAIRGKWSSKEEGDIGILAFCTQTRMPDAQKVVRTKLKDAYDKRGLRGDTMLIYETKTIRQYRFPSFPGEKFVPENYLYDLLDRDGTLLLLPEVIYVREYCSDGYTQNMSRLIRKNPRGYLAYIEQRLQLDRGLKCYFLDLVRYVAILKVVKQSVFSKKVKKAVALFAYLPGWMLYLKKYKV